jgi:hypothetical protein
MSASTEAMEMALEPCDQEKVLAWVQEKGLPRHCPSCGSDEDFVGCDLIELPIKQVPGAQRGTEIPVIPLICQVCGHVRLFSAKLIGVSS